MAILEVGLNLGNRNLMEIKYYSSSDNHGLDSSLRAGFLSALESFTTEVFGDDINVVSMASFKLVCSCEMLSSPEEGDNAKEPLLCFAIIEKDTDAVVVKKLIIQIISHFRNRFSVNDIFSKKDKYFKNFEERVNEILGDLKLKTEDRFRSLF